MIEKLYFAQKGFIIKDGRVLLIKKDERDPHQPGKWEVPGGRIKFGEDVGEHLKREIYEEVGLNVSVGRPFHVWQWQNKVMDGDIEIKRQIIAVARICQYISGNVSFSGNVKDDFLDGEFCWVNPKEILGYNVIENMIPCIKDFLKFIGDDT